MYGCRKFLRRQEVTFGAQTTRDVRFGGGHVGQTQSSFIEVLIGEKMGQAHVRRLLCHVHAELLQGAGGEGRGREVDHMVQAVGVTEWKEVRPYLQ